MSSILKGLNESAYRQYDTNRTGFSRGPRDDERHDLDVQQPSNQEWALKINGKVWSKDGKAVTFASKEQALKARQSLLAKRPELEVGLVTRGGVAETEGNFAGDTPVNIGGATVKRLGVGDIVSYLGRKAKINAQSKDREYSRITILSDFGGTTKDVLTSDLKRVHQGVTEEQLDEISNERLAQYKTAAAADAKKADSEGDYKRGDKRFSGIVKATKKQFANDEKNIAEDDLDENCWKGYHKEGNKELFGKTVPNCVKNEDVAEGTDKSLLKQVKPYCRNAWVSNGRLWVECDPLQVKKIAGLLNTKPLSGSVSGEYAFDLPQGVAEEQHSCPHCGGEMVSEELMNEKKDACYYKVKSRYKVWPSAYASGALVKCRKKGADSWGNGGKKNESSILEGIEQVDENLHKWFKEKWVRFGPDGKIRGDCARGDDSEGKPKCLPQSKAHSLGKKGRASAASRKRREDPNPERSGKAINVNTKKKSDESIDEGWKEKLGAAALTGAMALGAAGAQARVTPGEQDPGINRLTGKPIATQQATDTAPAKAEAPKGFSKEYLQSVIDGKHPRPMISVEKAQELLKQMNEDQLDEKWSQKYKDSINCSNPKGFSQRAHCQGKNK